MMSATSTVRTSPPSAARAVRHHGRVKSATFAKPAALSPRPLQLPPRINDLWIRVDAGMETQIIPWSAIRKIVVENGNKRGSAAS